MRVEAAAKSHPCASLKQRVSMAKVFVVTQEKVKEQNRGT
jgi:hypothetical protein